MRTSVYNHFKSIFESCNDFIICIDDNLNIVYTTDRVISIFNKRDISLLHLSCIFSAAQCNQVKFAMNGCIHSVSFDYVSVTQKVPRSCIVIPTLFENAYYFVLHISNTQMYGIDKLQKQDIEVMVDTAVQALADCTVPIVEIAKTLPCDIGTAVIKNVSQIRKVFTNIEIAAVNHTIGSTARVVEFYDYMKVLLPKLEMRLGKGRFGYTLLPCQNVYMSLISPADLDLMVVNLITEMIIRGNGRTHIHVMVCGDSSKNFIIISNSDHGLGYSPSELLDQSDSESIEIMNGRIIAARTAVSKLARDNGGKAFFTSTFGGGVTHGIMLKRSKARKTTLYEDPDRSARQNALLDILLSDI